MFQTRREGCLIQTPLLQTTEIEYDTFKYEKIAIIFLLFSADFFFVGTSAKETSVQ